MFNFLLKEAKVLVFLRSLDKEFQSDRVAMVKRQSLCNLDFCVFLAWNQVWSSPETVPPPSESCTRPWAECGWSEVIIYLGCSELLSLHRTKI